MARFLYAWELGGGYGHLAMIRDVALALAARGHTVTVAMRDLSRAGMIFDDSPVTVCQAPVWLPEATGLPAALNFPELLLRSGFTLPDRLRPLVDAWRGLLRDRQIDAVVAEHAPTAVLAARTAGVPVAMAGFGFTVPPPTDPMPSMVPGITIDEGRSRSAHRVVLDGINAILAHYRCPALASVGALFEPACTLLFTREALDPYAPARTGAVYLGARTLEQHGDAPPWPAGDGPRLVAYLKNDVLHLGALMDALRRCGARVLVHMPSTGPEIRRRLESDRIRIVSEPLPLGSLAGEIDGAVGIAGHGTLSTMLDAGVPMLVLATQIEQLGTARRLTAERLGLAIDLTGVTAPRDAVPDFDHPLGVLVSDRRLKERVRAAAGVGPRGKAAAPAGGGVMATVIRWLEDTAGAVESA